MRPNARTTQPPPVLRLPDGTRGRLAPGSHLRVAAEFGADRRDIHLGGEAFFDVVHDPRRPFTVFAGNAGAREVGTAFSVRAYPQDSAATVVVREGEVALADASVAALPFTGTLADVSPDAAVELVAATLGLEIRREGTRLLLAPTPGRTPAIR